MKSFIDICTMKQWLIYFLIFINSTLFGQQITQTVRGTIIDADSKQTLEGVAVTLITNPSTASSSDAKGNFKLLNVPIINFEQKCWVFNLILFLFFIPLFVEIFNINFWVNFYKDNDYLLHTLK